MTHRRTNFYCEIWIRIQIQIYIVKFESESKSKSLFMIWIWIRIQILNLNHNPESDGQWVRPIIPWRSEGIHPTLLLGSGGSWNKRTSTVEWVCATSALRFCEEEKEGVWRPKYVHMQLFGFCFFVCVLMRVRLWRSPHLSFCTSTWIASMQQ